MRRRFTLIRAGVFSLSVLAGCERNTGPAPTELPPAWQVASIAAGAYSTCAIGTDTLTYCWGYGNVGRPAGEWCSGLRGCGDSIPKPVVGAMRFVSLAAGGRLACGLVTSGTAYCWGGVGSIDAGAWSSAVPVPYPGAPPFTAISSGRMHTCGLDGQRHVWCWGTEMFGDLGAGDTLEFSVEPVLAAGGADFSAVAAGGMHVCAANEAGQLLCWGNNTSGQVGSGLEAPRHCGIFSFGRCALTPQGVRGGWVYTAVSAGGDHTCGVTAGTLVCWGSNRYGQLGTATNVLDSCGDISPWPCAPYPGHVGFPTADADDPIVAVAAGEAHTCALTTTGSAYCWGGNDYGQLGTGAEGDRAIPTRVAADGIAFRALSTGAYHTCGLATNGDAYCWGSNRYSQLGDGTTTDRWQPVRVLHPQP